MRRDTETPSGWVMSAEQAAQFLEIDVGTITEWAMAGKIPAIGEDGGWKFDKAALEAWMSSVERIARTGGEACRRGLTR